MNIDSIDIKRIVADVLARPGASAGTRPPASARAAVLVEKGRLELRQFPLRPIREDEILLRVEACGICGTDVHCFKGDPFNLCPVVLGHEGTGEVVQVGGAVRMDSVANRCAWATRW